MRMTNFWPALLAAVLGACGGSGGGSATSPPVVPPPPPPPPPGALSGQFKDANVHGLDYASPTRSGTTDALGSFTYQAGESVEFSIGGVVLGSAPGQEIVTPIDFLPGGSSELRDVQNRVRFLLLLDRNDDPEDGIEISDSVRQVAQNWQQVDFAASDFSNEVVNIVSDVASVDARPAALVSAQAATAHLEETAHCAMSGFFRGTITGDRSGPVVMIMNPVTGIVRFGLRASATDLVSAQPVSVDIMRTFIATSAAAGSNDNLEGRFDSYDQVSGVWTIGGNSGEFSLSRILPDPAARFRFTGYWYRGSVGVRLTGPLVLNVDVAGNLIAEGFDMDFENVIRATGTLVGQEFSYSYADGLPQAGTVDSNLYVEGTGVTSSGGPRPWFAQGCRLN